MAGENAHNILIPVLHSMLTRASNDSPYRSICPACRDGLLLVSRDPDTLALRRLDCCTLCGQLFRYDDVEIAGELVAD